MSPRPPARDRSVPPPPSSGVTRGRKRGGRPAPPLLTDAPIPTARDPRGDRIVAALGAVAAFVVYALTLTDTVSGGDSGELISVAYRLGVAHPPGYPLYTLLAKLTTLVPMGAIAWRVSLLSALCDAAAAMVLCRAVILWTGSRAAGVLAAGAFAFSPLVWPYAIAAEVFALNNLFVAGLLYFSV